MTKVYGRRVSFTTTSSDPGADRKDDVVGNKMTMGILRLEY
jgi:hypothetical protein